MLKNPISFVVFIMWALFTIFLTAAMPNPNIVMTKVLLWLGAIVWIIAVVANNFMVIVNWLIGLITGIRWNIHPKVDGKGDHSV